LQQFGILQSGLEEEEKGGSYGREKNKIKQNKIKQTNKQTQTTNRKNKDFFFLLGFFYSQGTF